MGLILEEQELGLSNDESEGGLGAAAVVESVTGLTLEEESELNSLNSRAGASESTSLTGLTPEEEAELDSLNARAGDDKSASDAEFSAPFNPIEEEGKQADLDFDLAVETGIPVAEIESLRRFRPKRKRPLRERAEKIASRFSDQLFNSTISSFVKGMTDSGASAASDRAFVLTLEWEKKNGIKLPDSLFEDQIDDWTRQLYQDPKIREADFLKGEPKFDMPEHVASFFDPREVEKAEGFAESAVDLTAGLVGFIGTTMALGRAFPKAPTPVIWETASLIHGGKPGAGSSMFGAMGLIGGFVPTGNPVISKLVGGVGTGTLFGTTTALAGGTKEEIILNTGLPIVLGFLGIKKSDWNTLKPKSKLALIQEARKLNPSLGNATVAQIDKAISDALVKTEVAGIRRLGKKPAAKKAAAKKTVKTDSSRKPVATEGKEVVSQHAKTLEARAILEGSIGKEGIDNIATHLVAGRVKQAGKARDIPNKDALRIVAGEKPLPEGVLMADVFVAVSRRARAANDTATLKLLIAQNKATELITRSAQELNALANQQKYSPERLGADVVEARGVIPNKKLVKDLIKAESKLDKVDVKLSKKVIDLAISQVKNPKRIKVDIKSKAYGTGNKLVTKARADAAMKRLGDTSTLFAGISPKKLADVLEISAFHVEASGRSFATYSAAMISQFGEKVKPKLKEFWKISIQKLGIAEREASISKLNNSFQKNNNLLGQTGTIRSLQETLIREGFSNRKTLLKEMHRILNKIDPTITERQAMDAMSGAGKFKLLKKDEVSVTRRDINNQFQQVSKLQDMQKGKAPSATGFERQPPSAEGRRLTKLVNEAKKKGGFESVTPERELKTALNGIKTRLKNRITDLDQQIKSGKRLIKKKTTQPSDAETKKLTIEKDRLQKQFDEMFGKQQVSPEQREKMAIKSVEKSISELTDKIKSGDTSVKVKTRRVKSDELTLLRSKRDALKEELKLMREQDGTLDQINLQAYKTRLANEKVRLDEIIASGDFQKSVKKEVKLDAAAELLTSERDAARRTVRIARDVQEQKGGIALDEVRKINNLSNSIEARKLILEQDPTNKNLQIDYGNAILDFKEYSQVLVPRPNTWRSVALDIAGTPRTLMTTIDLSFPFRQGWGSMGTKEFWKGFSEQFGYAFNEKNLRNLMAEIEGSPRLKMAKKSGLRLTDLGTELRLRPEGIQSTIPERIPILGRAVKASERAYTGMGNYIRWNRWNNMVDAAVLQGRSLKGAEGQALMRDISTVINIFTGTGNLGKAKRDKDGKIIQVDPLGVASPEINQLLFSARKLSADISMMNPALYVPAGKYSLLDPFARRMAQKQLIGSAAMTASILGLASMSGAEIELNPTSSKFGKILIGNRWVDITGGKASLFTLAARGVSGKVKDFKGEITETTPFKRAKLVTRFGRGKLSPMASLVTDLYLRQDYSFNPVETPSQITGAVATRFIPLSMADAIDLFSDTADGDLATRVMIGIPLTGAAVFGFGITVQKDKQSDLESF